MKITDPLDPEVVDLVNVPQGSLVCPGSDVAVNREAPVVTGDRVMDTQLENLRALLCDRVWSVYTMVTRVKKIRLWAQESRWGEGQVKIIPASLVRKDDHPWVQDLIEKAKELAFINSITCEAFSPTGERYVCSKLQLMQSQNRMRCLDSIGTLIKDIEKTASEELSKAQDLIKSFHAMAQQYKIHRDKLDHGQGMSDLELLRLASTPKP